MAISNTIGMLSWEGWRALPTRLVVLKRGIVKWQIPADILFPFPWILALQVLFIFHFDVSIHNLFFELLIINLIDYVEGGAKPIDGFDHFGGHIWDTYNAISELAIRKENFDPSGVWDPTAPMEIAEALAMEDGNDEDRKRMKNERNVDS